MKYLSLLILLLPACVVPLDLDEDEFEELYVVEALLTDELKQHSVYLTRTRSISEDEISAVEDAEVVIVTDNGVTYDFEYVGEGQYLSANTFNAEQGVSYQIDINLVDGFQLISSWESVPERVVIDDIYPAFAEIPNEDNTGIDPSVQFFIDANAGITNSRYFRVDYEETWEIRATFRSIVDWFGPGLHNCSVGYPSRPEQVTLCYQSAQSEELSIATSIGNESGNLVEYPLNSSPMSDLRFISRYTVLAEVYAINEGAFSYYRRLREINFTGGSLFDKQQGALIGNIEVSGNPNATVLGNFEVAAYSDRREFFTRDDFGDWFDDGNRINGCSIDALIEIEDADHADSLLTNLQGYVIVGDPCDTSPAFVGPATCSDCTLFGTNQKPDFWID